MRIAEREAGDAERLEALIVLEPMADLRDRYRIVLFALRGREKLEIAGLLSVAKSTVEVWAYRYRDGGIEELRGKPRVGSKPRLGSTASQALAARLDAEARFGQQGTTTRMWAKKGSRPTAVKQTRYEWLYLFAAVEPSTGHSMALHAPHVNTGVMNVFLEMLSRDLGPGEHAALIMDQAGWHKARKLVVPANITILYLPPYSPELNPVERVWAYLRSHYLSNRAYDDYQHLLDAGAEAWQQLTPEILRSVCACDYITPELKR